MNSYTAYTKAQIAEKTIGHLRNEGQDFRLNTNQLNGIQRAIWGPLIKVLPFGCRLLRAENHKKACAVPIKLKTAVTKVKKMNELVLKRELFSLIPATVVEVIKPMSSIEIL